MTSNFQSKPILALDIGGTKLMMALVLGDRIIERRTVKTAPTLSPDEWLQEAFELTKEWRGGYACVAAAVTGHIKAGTWSALNPKTLNIRKKYPLKEKLEVLFSAPAFVINDAQAAAWGEYRYGAGNNQDMVFLTVSTGIGGGIVLNGRLQFGQNGLAGHFGQWIDILSDRNDDVLENQIAGRWMADQASKSPFGDDARAVFSAAQNDEPWAKGIIETSATRISRLCRNIQMVIDPVNIVIGGGIGLAPGYLERVRKLLAKNEDFVSAIKTAQLGAEAGVIGCADLSLIY